MNVSLRFTPDLFSQVSAYIQPVAKNPCHFSIRATAQTEAILRRISERNGLTFWGEAAAIILAAEAASPGGPVYRMPHFLKSSRPRGRSYRMPAPRLLCQVDFETARLITTAAGQWKTGRNEAAAVILHNAAPRLGPLFMAPVLH